MNIYIGLFGIITISSCFSCWFENKNEKIKKILFAICILCMILVMGFRNPEFVGLDWGYYKSFFEIQDKYTVWEFSNLNSEYSRFELGFRILTKIISNILLNEKIYIMLISIVIMTITGYSIYINSRKPFLSLLMNMALNLYFFYFSGLRQSIAMAITLYSYKYVREKNFKKFLLCMIIAILFHKSAVVFFVVYFLRNYEFTTKNKIIALILGIIVFIFNKNIFYFINQFFYSNYKMEYTGSYRWSFLCIALLLICFINYKAIIKNRSDGKLLFNVVTIGAFCLLFSTIIKDVLRVANYFYVFIIFLVPEMIEAIKASKARILTTYVWYNVFFLMFLYLMKIDTYSVVPYVFWQ